MSLEEKRAARAARKAALQAAYERQAEIDLDALNAAEIEHGDNRVCYVEVPYVEGYPTMAIAVAPSRDVVSRYRTLCGRAQSGNKTDHGAILEATKQVARCSVIYPAKGSKDDPGEWERMCDQWQGLEGTLGAKAIQLHGAIERDEGNG